MYTTKEVATWLNVVLTLLAPVRHGRARQSSGTGPFGYCSGVLWVPARGVSIQGKFVLLRNLGYKKRGGSPRG